MNKFIIAFAVLLGIVAASPDILNTGGIFETVGSTLGGITSNLGGAVDNILGFGEKITTIPWIDLYRYFAVTHGIKKIPASNYCTCPYVYKGIMPKVPSTGLVNGVVDTLGGVVNTAGGLVNTATGLVDNVGGIVNI